MNTGPIAGSRKLIVLPEWFFVAGIISVKLMIVLYSKVVYRLWFKRQGNGYRDVARQVCPAFFPSFSSNVCFHIVVIKFQSMVILQKGVPQLQNSGPCRASVYKLIRSFCRTRQIICLLFNKMEMYGPVFFLAQFQQQPQIEYGVDTMLIFENSFSMSFYVKLIRRKRQAAAFL